MDNIVTAIFLFCLGLLLDSALSADERLQCYKCMHMTFEADNEMVQREFDSIALFNEERCKQHGKNFLKDATPLVYCGFEGDGIDWACLKSVVTIEIDFFGTHTKVEMIVRDWEIRTLDLGCDDINEDMAQEVFGEAVSSFEGEICVCITKGCNGGHHLTGPTTMGALVVALIARWMM